MSSCDMEKFYKDRSLLWERAETYGLYNNHEFIERMNTWVDHLRQEGERLNQGREPDPKGTGRKNAVSLARQLDKMHAFHVPADWWSENHHKSGFRNARAAKAAETVQHLFLWSKTEPGPAEERAKAEGGVILESSLAGKLFDGLGFGFQKWSDARSMQRLWEDFSRLYISKAEDKVKAVVLQGIVDSSVLTQKEWPELRSLMKAGRVNHLQVNVVAFAGDKKNSGTWRLQTLKTFQVHSQASFDKLPKPDDPDYWANQLRWHIRQRARAGSFSSKTHADSVYEIDRLFRKNAGKEVLVFFSGSQGLTDSPKEMSRRPTFDVRRPSQPLAALPSSHLQLDALDAALNEISLEKRRRSSNSSTASAGATSNPAGMRYSVGSYSPTAPVAGPSGYYSSADAGPSSGYQSAYVARREPYQVQKSPFKQDYDMSQAYSSQRPASPYSRPTSPVSSVSQHSPGGYGGYDDGQERRTSRSHGRDHRKSTSPKDDRRKDSRGSESATPKDGKRKNSKKIGMLQYLAGQKPGDTSTKKKGPSR